MRWTMVDEMNEMDCGLKETRWNMNNEMWTEGNETNNEVDNVVSPSLKLTILQTGQK